MGWDQERDANVVWEILKNRNFTLIGPRAVGPQGFFLGPLWYYLLVPFFFLTRMDPIAAPIFGVAVGIATTTIAYSATKKILENGSAIIMGLFVATSTDRVVWNPMLVPLLTILLIFFLYKALQEEKRSIVWVFLVFGVSLQIHFQTVFFAIPIAIALLFLFAQKKFFVKEIVAGVLIFASTFLPLIIFDLRNEFINSKSFLSFFQSSGDGVHLSHALDTYLKSIIHTFPLQFEANKYLYFFLFIVSLTGILTSKWPKQFKAVMFSFLLLPPLFFSFYGGNLSEYYFSLTTIPLFLGLTIILRKIFQIKNVGPFLALLILFLLLIQRIVSLNDSYQMRSLHHKRQAVRMIVDQDIDPIFNVSYSTAFNEDTGFRYLFKFYGKEPQDIPEGHLWTIAIPANSENVEPNAVFGDIGVIRR